MGTGMNSESGIFGGKGLFLKASLVNGAGDRVFLGEGISFFGEGMTLWGEGK